MRVKDCIFFQLAKAGQAGAQFWGKVVAPLGLTAVQAMVLKLLAEKDRVTSRILGQRAGLTSATVTGILDRLESMDLIERIPHPTDRRAVQVCLTEKGKRLVGDLEPLLEKANKKFMDSVESSDKKSLKSVLNKLRQKA